MTINVRKYCMTFLRITLIWKWNKIWIKKFWLDFQKITLQNY